MNLIQLLSETCLLAHKRRNDRCRALRAARACLLLGLVLLLGTESLSSEVNRADRFAVPEGLEVTLWASSPMFRNPTNIDIDARGRVWVAEAVNYRAKLSGDEKTLRRAAGDRIVVLEDTNGDGRANASHVFVQDEDLVAPLGISVLDNRVIVSSSPAVIIYTDVDRNGRFDPEVDKKETLLRGFGGKDDDHGLHALFAGPDGYWHLNAGNSGPHVVQDKAGWTLRAEIPHGNPAGGKTQTNRLRQADDDRVYIGGVALKIRPDGTGLSVVGHNFRNSMGHCLDSFGNLWQSDNDDSISCRTTWLMEYANTGYRSADGRRGWQADRRPDQSVPTAHWHQEDPGVLPAGDVYGPGAPTGMTFYENGALDAKYRGMLLSCEAGRNVVLGYLPEPAGAGFHLDRFSFMTSVEKDDPDYKWYNREKDERKWFRPSDVAIGPDGAIYVADWFDPVVGGHQMDDREGTGAIYRIAPKGFVPVNPDFDLSSTAGQIAALKSPARNIRWLGFERLIAQGEGVLASVTSMLDDENPYIAARAVWLLPLLGEAGRRRTVALCRHDDARFRVTAFRSLRAAGVDILALAKQLARDPSAAVRREVALAMRDVPLKDCQSILLDIAERYDGEDRWYLEAVGTGCDGKEDAIYPLLAERLGAAPAQWDARFAGLVWRLHPRAAVAPLTARALDNQLDEATRKQAIDTLAFIADASAARAMVRVARDGPLGLDKHARWWINFRRSNLWRSYELPSSERPLQLPPEIVQLLPDNEVYRSDVIRRGDIAEIDVGINGAKRLYLVVSDGADGTFCDWADWATPRLIGPEGDVKLTELPWTDAITGFGEVQINRNCHGEPLSIDNRSVPFGIGTHATSVIVFEIEDLGFERFVAKGGLDNGRGHLGGTDYPGVNPSVVFHIYHDGPTPADHAAALERTLLDAERPREEREQAAEAMARSKEGGLRLLALGASGRLPEGYSPLVAEHIHDNPNLHVRTIAGQYFPRTSSADTPSLSLAELAKIRGDVDRGRALFHGRATCEKCHRVGSEGETVGPDLTEIGRKFDRTRLLDAMVNPSAAILFGYEMWIIETTDGRAITGSVVGQGDPVIVIDPEGKRVSIAAADIEAQRQLSISMMPDIANLKLSEQDLADLAEYLINRKTNNNLKGTPP